MCGIFGAINFKNEFSDFERRMLEKSVRLTNYRGPDATGEMFFSTINNGSIFLGHNRLSIIDLSKEGNQPFTNDNIIFITFNGEIYNYIELREDLINKGYKFKSNTDTEVIINLYKEEGEKGFAKMNGMWALAIYDSITNRVILSRDRFSEKPLYYTSAFNIFYFSSEIKQLLPFLRNRKINTNVFANYMHNYLVDYSEETFFEEIYKIPPKSNLVIDLSTNSKVFSRYWDYSDLKLLKSDPNNLKEEYIYLLNDSVKLRLRSDVEVGNTLSGGLDSSSIAVIAKSLGTEGIKNYSIVAKEAKYSEEYFIDNLTRTNGISVNKIFSNDIDFWKDLEEVIWHNDEPILSLSTIAHFNMMKTFRKNSDIKVILSGQGGDESLGGYNKYYFEYLKELIKSHKYFRLSKESLYLLPKFFGQFNINSANRYLNGKFSQITVADKILKVGYNKAFVNNSSDFSERQKLDIDNFSVPALTHYEDRMSMSQSLEIRLPFLDYRLVNFSINLPTELKIKNGYSKYILRTSLKELPKEVAWRKDKMGFGLNEDEFLRPSNYKIIESLFRESILESYNLIDKKEFFKILNMQMSGRSRFWVRDINRVIFAEKWAQIFMK